MSTTILGKEYQAKVKQASNVLVGVAQVRVGKPSVRDAGTAVTGTPQVVVPSTINSAGVLIPDSTSTKSTDVAITTGGSYTGDVDGNIIIRSDGTDLTVYSPQGVATSVSGLSLTAETVDGVELTGDFDGSVEGDTYIVPVWSGSAQNKPQTGIATPYSMFSGSTNSIGGLRSASFSPSLDDVKVLESGFPAEVDDRIVTKTSVKVSFEALEYTNDVMGYLKDMVSSIINDATYAAVPVEVVMRTRGNQLVTFWIPNANLESTPEIAPQDDFSSMTWELGGAKMTEIANPTADAAIATYNKWLAAQYIYRELTYVH